jgi:AAA+ superfamily predicted ATPase
MGVYRQQLEALIGLESVKQTIQKISAYAEVNKNSDDLNLHMCFYGNPGTGKTEVARIIAGLLCEIGVLPTNQVVEVDRSDLVGAYVGETAIKTTNVIQSAMGGVLFIDEAYSLAYSDSKADYGNEAIATLIKAMEDKRGKFCVILAGYKNPMLEMISSNPGFRSRIQFELDFPNYSRNELGDITDSMIRSRGYVLTEEAKELLLDITDLKRKESNFANAREVRNILDHMIMCQNMRALSAEDREI